MKTYPVGLVVEGRPCLVVGGGSVAARKAEGLLAAGAIVTVVAPHLSPALRRLTGVQLEERTYRTGEAAEYRLVIAATDDTAVNSAVHEDAEAGGVWVNAADDPAHCTVVLPAVLRRGPVTVSVSTGGDSPALAVWLRDRIADIVGPEYVELATELAQRRRALHAAGISTETTDWRGVIEQFVATS